MKRNTFHFEFEDESAAESGRKHDTITYEDSPAQDERLRVEMMNGAPFVFANSTGLLTLAKILVKIAMSKYRAGFHVHLHQDFNADLPEVLGVGLDRSMDNGVNPTGIERNEIG
jgi:hypothetical protein